MNNMNKEEKTSENLLNESLVSEEEKPYDVPDNWTWTKLGAVATFYNGSGFPKKYQGNPNSNISFYKVGSLKNTDENFYLMKSSDTISEDIRKALKAKLVPRDVTLFAKIGEAIRLNRRALSSEDCCIDNNLMGVKGIKNILEDKYLFYWSLKENFYNYTQATTIPSIRKSTLENIKFPLPPFNEQQRISNKVKGLLSKIDEATQLIDEAKETFKIRRETILNKAFRGELTAEWREENENSDVNFLFRKLEKKQGSKKKRINKNDGVIAIPYKLPDGWKWIRLRDIATFKSGYAFKSNDFVKEGYQLIRMGNLYKNQLDLSRNPVFLPKIYDEEIINKYSVESGEILLTLTGTKYKRDYGYAIRVKNQDRRLLLNQRILSLKPYELSDYFYYYLQSNTFRDMFFSFETGGVNQGNVGSTAVESIYIPLPPLEEGIEIQKKIERLLAMEKCGIELLDMKNEIETIKQSVLSKAFRGELGTNLPTEESAKEILSETLHDGI